jgi:hypothetical protein
LSDDNPFMSLKSDEEKKYRLMQEQMTALESQLDEMVTKVLTQLKEAFYPDAEVYREACSAFQCAWYLGNKFSGEKIAPYTIKRAVVLLVKDTENSLPYFLCGVGDDSTPSKKCGLLEGELVDALLELLKSINKKNH